MENTSDLAGEPQAQPPQLASSSSAGSASDVSTSGGSTTAVRDTAVTPTDLITTHDLSPNISSSPTVAVSVSSMIDTSEFRSQMPEPTYHTLNGRMSPGYNSPMHNTGNSYATLTPLQPLPPISTVSEKFGHATSPNVSGSFTLMQNNNLGGMDMNYRYHDHKLAGMSQLQSMNMGVTTPSLNPSPMPMTMSIGMGMGTSNGYAQVPQTLTSYPSYNSPNGLHSPDIKPEPKIMMSPASSPNMYDNYPRGIIQSTPIGSRLHSPNPVMPTTINGIHPSHISSPHSHNFCTSRDRIISSDAQGSKHELEEINTKELAQKISSELKRYSIPQAVFAQRVLCRSQGTLSDLLRNPKPWSKLKSGRETFRRMWKWLQEPEFQRMSALRLAGFSQGAVGHPGGQCFLPGSLDSPVPSPALQQTCKRKDDTVKQENPGPKKPRLVFTDIQRRTLLAIFKETKRPSKEMQTTIAEQLGLKVSTVANFFMNARRRSLDKYTEDPITNGDTNGITMSMGGLGSMGPLTPDAAVVPQQN